ncbi:hypothetical protein DEA8626_02885 [Defluviimonas aquaemixtae]|uniref:RNA-binding protein n=1 Tax=Albidovulum aquaemixtae TaxID=1542388 RepID=A0A2R8BKH4_9RHOB|nr:DUF721 domain-containing protein [Defluviimonas aquaemixtae]SPH23813.1 hypothetical protein DEA8626_02885 [Defluviimonas aquaemixtae]
MTDSAKGAKRRARGFEAASGLLKDRIRRAGESRGFVVSRLLTHWPEVVGEEIAAMARPVKVGYGREGFGATLMLLTTGAAAPVLQMQLPKIREKVNACYGYNAISRVTITQTAPAGFAEGQVQFAPAPPNAPPETDPAVRQRAAALSGDVHDLRLRAALEALGEKVLSRPGQKKG